MYADRQTAAMHAAIDETNRRREIQIAHNREHGITAETVKKGISDITEFLALEDRVVPRSSRRRAKRDEEVRTPEELERLIVELEEEMFAAAEDLRFEYAAKLRDEIKELRREYELAGGRDQVAGVEGPAET
jgi:excinuclease ABC subunit B